MIEIKETLVIKSDSPKVAEWVKRMKAYKAAQLQDMAKRGTYFTLLPILLFRILSISIVFSIALSMLLKCLHIAKIT